MIHIAQGYPPVPALGPTAPLRNEDDRDAPTTIRPVTSLLYGRGVGPVPTLPARVQCLWMPLLPVSSSH